MYVSKKTDLSNTLTSIEKNVLFFTKSINNINTLRRSTNTLPVPNCKCSLYLNILINYNVFVQAFTSVHVYNLFCVDV